MVKQAKKKVTTKRGSTLKPKVLESITGTDALAILKVLAERYESLAQEIDAVAKELLGHIEIDEVAANVQLELEFLNVEDVWDRSGAKRDGYVDPGEAACEMFEEALKPFQDEMDKYKQLSMLEEANLACQGLLKGIYNFDKESSTEYKQWVADAPGEYFGMVLDDWKKLFEGQAPLSSMREFLKIHCPDWAEWAIKSLRSRRP
jgi:hypothetical protein